MFSYSINLIFPKWKQKYLCVFFLGWITFQRRRTADIDFFRGWNDYVLGFGNVVDGFWIGLDNLHLLTKCGAMMNVDLWSLADEFVYMRYSTFTVDDLYSDYTLTVDSSSGIYEQ